VVAVEALVAAVVGTVLAAAAEDGTALAANDGAALGAEVTVAVLLVVPPHAARSTAVPDRAPRVSRKLRLFIARGWGKRPGEMPCRSIGSFTGYLTYSLS
jgi:hypothetical protein